MSDSASLSVCCLKGEYGGVTIFRRNDAIFTEIKQILVLACTNRQSFTVARWNKSVLWLKWFILVPPCYIISSCGTLCRCSAILLSCHIWTVFGLILVTQIHLTCRQSIFLPVAKSFKLHFWSATKNFASFRSSWFSNGTKYGFVFSGLLNDVDPVSGNEYLSAFLCLLYNTVDWVHFRLRVSHIQGTFG